MTKFFINKHQVESGDTLWSLAKHYGLNAPGAIYFFGENEKKIELKNEVPILKIGKVIDIPFSERDLKLVKILLRLLKSRFEILKDLEKMKNKIKENDLIIDSFLLVGNHANLRKVPQSLGKASAHVTVPTMQFIIPQMVESSKEKEKMLWLELTEVLLSNASVPTNPIGASLLIGGVASDLISLFGRKKIDKIASKAMLLDNKLFHVAVSKLKNSNWIKDMSSLTIVNQSLKNVSSQMKLPYHFAKL